MPDICPIILLLKSNLGHNFQHAPISCHWGPFWSDLQSILSLDAPLNLQEFQDKTFCRSYLLTAHNLSSPLPQGRSWHWFKKQNFCLFLHIPFFLNKKIQSVQQKSKFTHIKVQSFMHKRDFLLINLLYEYFVSFLISPFSSCSLQRKGGDEN